MPEDTAQAGNTPEEGAENEPIEGSRTFTQDEVNKLIGEMRAKDRAKFKEYKDKASRLDEIEEQSKTELEKANERAEKLEQERDALAFEKDSAAWKKEAAEACGVPLDALEGSTKEDIFAHAERLKPFFAKPSAPIVDTGEPSHSDGAEGDWLRNAINGK